MSTEIAGLPVTGEPRGLMTPLIAVAVVKGLDTTGARQTWLLLTEGTDLYDAIGMHRGALVRYEHRLLR